MMISFVVLCVLALLYCFVRLFSSIDELRILRKKHIFLLEITPSALSIKSEYSNERNKKKMLSTYARMNVPAPKPYIIHLLFEFFFCFYFHLFPILFARIHTFLG